MASANKPKSSQMPPTNERERTPTAVGLGYQPNSLCRQLMLDKRMKAHHLDKNSNISLGAKVKAKGEIGTFQESLK